MNVIICGSREYQHTERVYDFIKRLPDRFNIIVGDAKGVDEAVIKACAYNSRPCEIYQANWKADGRQAGIRRNLSMLNQLPTRVVAFWDGESKGTKFMIDTSLKRRINLQVYFDF